MRGRKKGTILSEQHKENVAAALRRHFETNEPWNKGNKKLPKERTDAEKLLGREKRLAAVIKAAKTRRQNTIEKYISKQTGWDNPVFDVVDGKDLLSITHTQCGNRIRVQTQTIRKWNWGDALCKHCNPVFRGVSKAETEVAEFIKSLVAITSHYKLPSGLELDIVVPSHMLAVEYDGLYWHSDRAGYSPTKHLQKTQEAAGFGYRLIHVFEDEWTRKPELVKSRLRTILGVADKHSARSFQVKSVCTSDAKAFLTKNHIQGYAQSSVKFGLFSGEELLCVMTFGKPRYRKDADWELIRFATKAGIVIRGGASRLLAAFRKQYSGSVVSYADMRWSVGNVYEKMGFRKIGQTSPGYFYFKGDLRENRQSFQKKKLVRDGADASKTEVEIMFDAGWNRIWDCGNLIYFVEA